MVESLDPLPNATKFSATFTHQIARERWVDIVFQLNALPGIKESWENEKRSAMFLTLNCKTKSIVGT